MEIRLLQEEELKVASGLSRYVFDTCIRERMEFEQTGAYIEEYLFYENILDMVQNGRLFVWGGFREQELVAVSAMEPNGLITMLYVLPATHKQGYGTAMLKAMREYAKEQLQLDEVMVNVTPVWRATYFLEREFRYLRKPNNMHVPYISMISSTVCKHVQTKKKVPGWILLVIGAILLTVPTLLCIVSAFLYGLQI